MEFLGSVGASAVSKASAMSKRAKSEPSVMLSSDSTILMSATSISAVVLILAIFLGEDIYHSTGLRILHELETDAKTQYAIEYCWSHFNHLDIPSNTVVSLYHYTYFPYLLFLFSTCFYIIFMSWKNSGFNKLAHVLEYMLDGLEEQIRDIILFLLKDIKEKKEKYEEVKNDISIDLSDKTSKLLHQNSIKEQRETLKKKEKFLHVKLEEYFASELYHRKYHYFNYLLAEHVKTNNFVRMIIYRRFTLLTFLMIVIGFIYYQFLMVIRNPSVINCVIPSDVSNQTIQLLFSPVKIRTTLMWLAFYSYIFIFLAAIKMWTCSFMFNPGLNLLRNILPKDLQKNLKIDQKRLSLKVAGSNLNLIFSLVFGNRNRLQYIQIAFTALYASEEKNIGLKSHGNFLSVLRESMLWMVDGNEHDEIISKVANGLTSNMSDA